MKFKYIKATLALFVIISSQVSAHEACYKKAITHYNKKAKSAENKEDAKIYKRLAEIQKEALAANKEGKKYKWNEHHKLTKQLKKEK